MIWWFFISVVIFFGVLLVVSQILQYKLARARILAGLEESTGKPPKNCILGADDCGSVKLAG